MNIKTHRRPNLTTISDYEQYVGAETVDRISKKSEALTGLHVAHVNSTYYGGGVAELLSSLTLLMNAAGIKVGWRVLQGSPDFFSITKKMHNALQGAPINLSDLKVNIYEDIIYENALRNHLDHDVVIIHDPQPLAMINHYKKHGPWIWRCHIDLSNPNPDIWKYLKGFIDTYDATILSIPEYRQELDVPQMFFMPAINPFNIKNKEMSEAEINDRMNHYDIPTDLPLVVQISRFDRWKDPEGVIEAFKIARKEVDATLVLLGDVATDDPGGERVYQSLLDQREERIIILSKEDTALVNALQRKAAVVVQKSIREGFGLTVTEAMWKGTPVIGGNAGGIRHQIADGVNGFLVSSVEEASQRMIELLNNEKLRARMGEQGKMMIKKDFLLIRLLEQYLDLFGAFESRYELDMSKIVE